MSEATRDPAPADAARARKTGWNGRARAYHAHQGKVSAQAVGPLLDAAGIAAHGGNAVRRVLDVATGPGYGAGEAARRGARAIGLDFSATMVAVARHNFPEATFVQGDGEALPFADGSFDAVICCFGMPQMPDPGRALAEVCRVLGSGGHFGLSLRGGLEHDAHKQIVDAAVRACGDMGAAPTAQSETGLRDPARYRALLAAAAFTAIETTKLTVLWRPRSGREMLETFYNGSRSSRLLEHQSPEARTRIERAILDFADRFRTEDGFAIPRRVVLIRARKGSGGAPSRGP